MSAHPFRLSRRHVLRGLGVSLTLPLLDVMKETQAAPSKFKPLQRSGAAHPRAVFCYVPNGVNILEWMPKDEGVDYTLSPTLKTLEKHKSDFTVFTGLGHPASDGGHAGADTWLTAADLDATPGKDYRNSVSADQVIAAKHGEETRFPSLQLSDQSGTGSALHSHTLSFDRNGTPLPAENSPRRLFDRLFVPESSADREATLKRYALRKSILDSVQEETKRLGKRLGKSDREKLAQYYQSVRETETRVDRLTNWVDVPKPEVSDQDLQLDSQPGNAHDRPMWLDVMLELSYLAMITDTTRVISFEWSREAGGFGGGGENHHELSHHGGDAEMLKRLAQIDRFHLQRLNRFLDFLSETSEGEGCMLDQTMILFGSGMNSGEGGEHSPKNLPILVAGGKSLGVRHSGHVAHDPDKHPPLSNLLLSMIQKTGVEADRFADSTSTLV
ncbi:DUF1552 domain-containing protein [Neorhodopirellula pilleata]|uniref:DUF1552 domain-containing protein n=1 Tax=Neorhodopirellula pilleata TaxID=2714738 RepID=A0A5C6AVY0_9BACT|nr:DUF1552 domain-containing protein [Neorhodopirellula pilleata]TWU03768.1 hypothetical protein Pla100_06980 [Neorhodopirellula pilleata]